MNIHRFNKIVSAYGNKPKLWPSEERQQASQFLDDNPLAQSILDDADALEKNLSDFTVREPNLHKMTQAILADIDNKTVNQPSFAKFYDRVIQWLIPATKQKIWQPALAASLPLIFGLLFGINLETDINSIDEQWDTYQYMSNLSSSSYQESNHD